MTTFESQIATDFEVGLILYDIFTASRANVVFWYQETVLSSEQNLITDNSRFAADASAKFCEF